MINNNKYIVSFVNGIIKSLRSYFDDAVNIRMSGTNKLFNTDSECLEFIDYMSSFGFYINIEGDNESVSEIDVTCVSACGNHRFVYKLDSVPYLLELSSKTGISLYTLITMKIVSLYISKTKTLFKALALDLDETLWNGILSEDGIQVIKDNLQSEAGKSYVDFMKFVCNLAKELGLFVAICSRNDISLVKECIDQLDENYFPIKNQVDCIVANNNDKSSNLIKIAEQLSILPESIIFIDDNSIVRDEVREKIPKMLVPEWTDHKDLILQIITGGYFDRPEVSLSAQNRKKEYKIINEEKQKASLPSLRIRVIDDKEHFQSRKLYAKSNQFKLSRISKFDDFEDDEIQSVFFELHRENGEALGICSAISFYASNNKCVILNWAISCRYFEIGLEEFVIIYMYENLGFQSIDFIFQANDRNNKVADFIDDYYGTIVVDDCSSIENDSSKFIDYLPEGNVKKLMLKIREQIGDFMLYSFIYDDLLKNQTNLKLL